MAVIKIGIVDDHPMVISGLKMMLESESGYEVCSSFNDGQSLLDALPKLSCDVLILDLKLPDADGLDLLLEIKEAKPNVKVVVLSSFDKGELIRTAIQHGASGYMCKDAAIEEMMNAINLSLKGEVYIEERLRGIYEKTQPDRPSYIPVLTDREQDILKLILKEHTNTEIADQLCLSPKTTENYRLNLLQKLGVRNTAGLVRVAFEKGLL